MCNILLNFDGINIYSKLLGTILCKPLRLPKSTGFVIFVSSLCGNPLGAKYSMELYEKKAISQNQCERLLSIASNVSPLFIIGTVGTAMLKSPELGYLLLIANYLSCLILGVLISLKAPKINNFTSPSNLQERAIPNLGTALKDSIENAIKTTLSVGGYIIIFYVLIDIIGNNFAFKYMINLLPNKLSLLKEILTGSLLGIIELTRGCHIVSESTMNILTKLTIIGFLMGFSGLSIITQIYSFTSKHTELKISLFIKRKLLQGIINGILATTLYYVFYFNRGVQQTISTYPPNEKLHITIVIILFLCPVLLHLTKKIFNSN
jgi:sporulation integral membrane protein YlbJ